MDVIVEGGGAVPFREVKISPHMDVAGKIFLFLGDFAQFSQKKMVAWLDKRGGRITKKLHRKVSIAICGENVPQSVSDRLLRLEIERWDEFDTLNYVAMYYLKSDVTSFPKWARIGTKCVVFNHEKWDS